MVAPAIIGAGISAAGGLLSDIMGNRSAKKQNQQQVQAIRQANKRAEKREDTRIQRVVADAKSAGIHPLAALGSPSVGSFATPQAAYGGAPISGSGIGDAVQSIGNSVGQMKTNMDSLQEQLLRAQIRNVDASTMQMRAEAVSRSTIANARLAGQSVSTDTGVSSFGPFKVKWADPRAAQTAQDAGGDILEQFFGISNLGDSQISVDPNDLGPLSKMLYRKLLGNDFTSGTGR